MQGYLLILLFTALNLAEGIIIKAYGKRYSTAGMLMNAIIALFAALFFLITDKGGFYAPAAMLPYALINMCLYATGFYLTFVAFKIGPYGLTRLISGFSLIMPIFYGLFFLNEETTALTYIGISLIFAAMVLINLAPKKNESKTKSKEGFSAKWLVCILVSSVANGFISILTRMQQIKFNNACSNEFQAISIGGSFVLLAILALITERRNFKTVLKSGLFYGVCAGLANGAKNLTIILIYLYLPISIVSPIKSSLGMIATFLVSTFFYKEKYTLIQKVGVLCGIAAVVLLAL